jgi:hypothetical protein
VLSESPDTRAGIGADHVFLIQMLLPKYRGEGEALDPDVSATRAELVDRFGGVTAYERAPALGAWRAPAGHIERDDVVMVEVVAEAFDREWWRSYRSVLEARFAQQEILVRAIRVEVP